jgi:Ca2+/Na+ antiporter
VVAGRIALHRKVVVLGGGVGIAVSVVCLLAVAGVLSAPVALAGVLAVLIPYLVILSVDHAAVGRVGLPSGWATWLTAAIDEEETELDQAVRPQRGTRTDTIVAGVALGVVIVASAAMERGASALGSRYNVAEIIIGGLVLAAVTSLPNAVAAVYLADKGRGAAALSTALNSNTINVTAGLLIPATIIGLAKPSGSGLLVAGWYVGLTALTLTLAYLDRGLRRAAGWLIIAAYLAFVGLLLATS